MEKKEKLKNFKKKMYINVYFVSNFNRIRPYFYTYTWHHVNEFSATFVKEVDKLVQT